MKSVREQHETIISKYDVSNSLRIQYQLYLQKVSLTKLLEEIDDNGNKRTELEIEEYKNGVEDKKSIEYKRYQNYLYKNNMPDKAYRILCKKLHINEKINLDELEEISQWQQRLENAGISFKRATSEIDIDGNSKYFHPQKKDRIKRQELAQEVNELVKKQFVDEEQALLDEQEQQDLFYEQKFNEYVKSLTLDVVHIWHEYSEFFEFENNIESAFFYDLCNLNQTGKQLFHQIVKLYLEEQDYNYSDERIELYTKMMNANHSEYKATDISSMTKAIYAKWAKYADEEYISYSEELTKYILEATKEEWECLIDYHRLFVLGKDLVYENRPFLDYLEKTFDLIVGAPIIRI